MTRSCCAKPITTIIKVGDFEAGIIGLAQAFAIVSALDKSSDQETKTELLKFVRQFGNYITPARENEYKEAMFREYIKFKNAPRGHD
jgi:hypothetical protein